MKGVKQCLILAAGNGSRIASVSRGVPKPLVPLCGAPLLEHVMMSAQQAGIEKFVIVAGYRADSIRSWLNTRPRIGTSVTLIENLQYHKANGVSALAAKEEFHDPFLLLMADHIFEPRTAKALLRQPLTLDEVILAVDSKLDDVFDLDDATKVRREGSHVVEIGKDLARYDALDTGMFLCSPALFDRLESAKRDGDCSLSDGMRHLARRQKLRAFDIGHAHWHDVDSPEALVHAEKVFERDFCDNPLWKRSPMFKIPPKARRPLRVLAVAMSASLFAYLIWRAGPSKLWENVMTLGWGFTWVIALAGVSHVAKTWAWQLTLGEDKHKVSFPRMLGLRLGSEAAGQLGILGQTFGDSIRVSHLSPEIRTASGLASVTLDRGLYIVTGAMITIAGIVTALSVLSLSRTLRLYAGLFVVILIAFLLLTLLGVRKRWPVLSGSARIIGRVPFLKNWMDKEYLLIQSVENTLLDFHHNLPKAFWASFCLNLACHCMAVLEVCLVLWLMKTKLGFFGALVVEAFTKIVNVMGNINPGNIGTYEGGNMLIGKMFGLNVATGLVLGLARRLRSLIWAAVGIICLFLLTRPRRRRYSEGGGSTAASAPNNQIAQADPLRSFQSDREAAVVILIANEGTNSSEFEAPLARVGTLPILLRTILAAQKLRPSRIVVVLDPINRRRVQRDLFFTGRLPESVLWIESAAGTSLVEQLRLIAAQSRSERLLLIEGNTTYHSSLLRKASEWNDNAAALALTSRDNLVGIYALTVEMIRRLAEHSPSQINSLEELHAGLAGMHSVVCMPVAESLWQRVCSLEDRVSAEQKLNGWLVKPTDGIYARLNRRISIPISRQLIKFPITPNMVSIFTLGVGVASAAYFAFGGYWNTLLGAFLCLFASVLDGCDGEVARLKLLESDFGCWLETMCDYLFYLLLFVGMTVGLWRSSGSSTYLVLGGLLLFGAMASFFAAGWERHRLATGRPEQLLGIWQTHAESRPSNPLLYIARHTEFIIRRCFFPYALIFFALFNIMNVAFVLSVIGANLVWPIALYSSRAFAGVPRPAATRSAAQFRSKGSCDYQAVLP